MICSRKRLRLDNTYALLISFPNDIFIGVLIFFLLATYFCYPLNCVLSFCMSMFNLAVHYSNRRTQIYPLTNQLCATNFSDLAPPSWDRCMRSATSFRPFTTYTHTHISSRVQKEDPPLIRNKQWQQQHRHQHPTPIRPSSSSREA